MLKRIDQLIKNLDISPSQFADEIQVQRSSISHVLSGRNKPSLDFITKIIKRYPEIDPEWLLTGRGKMYSGSDDPLLPGSGQPGGQLAIGDQQEDSDEEKQINPSPVEKARETPAKKAVKGETPSGHGRVMKIVLFYSDGQFREFSPDDYV